MMPALPDGQYQWFVTAYDCTTNNYASSQITTFTVASGTSVMFQVGGTISGLTGSGLTLATTGEPNLAVVAGATSFAFANTVASGTAYAVTVAQQPVGQKCTVTNGAGSVTSNVNNIIVTCGTNTAEFVTTFAGISSLLVGNQGSIDGTGYAARFNGPSALAFDGSGNLYVADTSSNVIRAASPAAAVTTLAGTVGSYGYADGAGLAAQFAQPTGVAVDGAGNIYVADEAANTIRKITSAGVVTTFAGAAGQCGYVDGTGTDARLCGPWGVAVDSSGNLFVAEQVTSVIRKITPAGVVTTFAGTAYSSGSADGTGPNAQFSGPRAVAVDGADNIYVADTSNNTIRKITPAGVVTTLAGTAPLPGSDDGIGAAARFLAPTGVAVDGAGNVYVADSSNELIRQITPAGVVTTLAGNPMTPGLIGYADGPGPAAQFFAPTGIAVDGAGNVFVADTMSGTIRKISATMPGGPTQFVLSGTISGLTAPGLVLATAGEPSLPLGSAATVFAFANPLSNFSTYSVSIAQQPNGQTCMVRNGVGVVAGADVVAVAVSCVDGTVTRVDNASYQPGAVRYPGSIAFSGTAYATTWWASGTGNDLLATEVDAGGALVDPAGELITHYFETFGAPAVACAKSGQCVTVWIDIWNRLRGELLDATGAPIGAIMWGDGTDIGSHIGGAEYPSIAFDGTNYVLAWCSYLGGGGVAAVRLSPAGRVLDPVPISISSAPANGVSVASNGTETLVAWAAQAASGQTAFAVRVSTDGVVLDSAPISLPSGSSINGLMHGQTASDGVNFAVVWNVLGTSSTSFVTRINSAGVIVDVMPSQMGVNAAAPQIAFDGINYVLAWQETALGVTGVTYAHFSPAGAGVMDGPITIADGELSGVASAGAGSVCILFGDGGNQVLTYWK
jgi:sugar lactone lactonase YvrE